MKKSILKNDLQICFSRKDCFEIIFNSVKEGIVLINSDMLILNLNKAAAEYGGVTRDRAIGKIFSSVFKNHFRNIEIALKKAFKKYGPVKGLSIDYFEKNGNQKKLMIKTAFLADTESSDTRMVILFEDITELSKLRRKLDQQYKFQSIIGKNKKMQEIYWLIERVADSDATTLILGESGTGKELAAQAIHEKSRRAKKAFVKVNCSALSESLLESELFGHVKGAYTDAISDRIGRFQLADKGTIFLDEIGDISLAIQVKLLRALQEGVIERVGDPTPMHVDARIICATNKDLKKLINNNFFREDLYYRLKIISMKLPPLRERKDDIVPLVTHFIKKYNLKTGKNIQSINDDVLDLFMRYPWKGNVRELENAIEHAFVLCRSKVIATSHIPVEIKDIKNDCCPSEEIKDEKKLVESALIKSGWNKSKAARALGIDRTTLWRKTKEMGIKENPLSENNNQKKLFKHNTFVAT